MSSSDKSKVTDWLGQSTWKGGFQATKHEVEKVETIVIKPVEWDGKNETKVDPGTKDTKADGIIKDPGNKDTKAVGGIKDPGNKEAPADLAKDKKVEPGKENFKEPGDYGAKDSRGQRDRRESLRDPKGGLGGQESKADIRRKYLRNEFDRKKTFDSSDLSIRFPDSTSGPSLKKKTNADSASSRGTKRNSIKPPKKMRHPIHHLHLHVHAEVVLDELPYLGKSEFIFIRSMMDVEDELPHFIGTSPYSRYQVWDRARAQLFTGVEAGRFLVQFLLGPSRPFTLKLYNPDGQMAYIIRRPSNCWLLFMGGHYFGNGAVVHDTKGKLLGKVTQRWGYLKPTYDIRNESGESILFAQGTTQNPIHVMFQRIHFNLFSTEDYENVGLFTRHHWHNIFYKFKRETEEGSSFGVAFPKEFAGTMYIQILAAAFLLNISYFEHKTGGISGFDIFFYLTLTWCAMYIVHYYYIDAFYHTDYINWCDRFNSCIAENASTTTTPKPKPK